MEQAPIREVIVERPPRFLPPDILWYFGGLVAAFAADALIADTSSSARGVWQLLVGLACMAVFGALAAALIRVGLRIPGGVLAAVIVWLAPPTEVGFEHLFGVHPRLGSSQSAQIIPGAPAVPVTTGGGGFHGAWFAIALGTVVVGLAVYWLVRFAFVLLPVVLALVLAAVLFMPAVVSHPSLGDWIATVLVTGIVFSIIGLLLDARLHRRDAFWWYAIGLFEITIAFTYYLGLRHHHWVWLLLLVVAIVALLASAPLERAVWATYAVTGIYAALVHYTEDITGSWKAALVLTLVGIALLAFGLVLDVLGAEFVGRITRPWTRQPPPPAV